MSATTSPQHQQQPPQKPKARLLLALDVGTTNVKCCVYEGTKCALLHSQEEQLSLQISPNGELVEMDPDQLWAQILRLMQTAVDTAEQYGVILAIGLSCQRNTFLTWDKKTLKPCHRLITWKDNRARQFCADWNRSGTKMLLNFTGCIAHFFTRSQRYKAARMFRLLGAMVPPRFLITLEQNQNMRALLAAGELALGTMDCWLLQRLSGGQAFLSEPSSASSTGMFDPFTDSWGQQILDLLNFPYASVLPPLVETTKIGVWTDEALFGRPIEIVASLGDSQAAAFGAGCVRKGDVKISLGTGTLFDYVSGGEVHASMCGMYPLVGWKMDGQSTHLLEGRANDTASALQWAHSVGLLQSMDPIQLEASTHEAADVDPGDGALCFVPAFGGVQTPLDEDGACAGLLGIRHGTTRPQVVRALLEAMAFGVYQIWECLLQEVPAARQGVCRIRCCGGVSRNDLVCQQVATLLGRPLERVREPEFCSAKGAALLAGISAGLWSLSQAEELVSVERTFQPIREQRAALFGRYRRWQEAQRRCLFYNNPTDEPKQTQNGKADPKH